jgi:hypothetical protein
MPWSAIIDDKIVLIITLVYHLPHGWKYSGQEKPPALPEAPIKLTIRPYLI